MDQFIVAVFHDETTAKQAAQALKDLRTGGRATLNGMSVISKDHQGKVAVGEIIHEGTRGAVVAALVSALAGGVAGGPLAAGLFAAGGAVFGLSADLIHRSSTTEIVNRASQELSPGRAAVIAHLSEVKDVDIIAIMQELGGKMIEQKSEPPEKAQVLRQGPHASAALVLYNLNSDQEVAMDEFDLIGDALCSVRMVKAVYGTGHDGATRIDEVAEILRLRAKQLSGNDEAGRSKSTMLAMAVADAIRKAYGTPV